jgi:pyruvate-ferredoxin/flavodoxin oxidoreductase
VHPLLTYDPRAEGVFGARIDLSANPSPGALWVVDADGGVLTPAHWAAGHARGRSELSVPSGAGEREPIDAYVAMAAEERGDIVPVVSGVAVAGGAGGAGGDELAVSPRLVAAVEDRRGHWTTLQELAGLVTPFTRQVRERAERELASEHQQRLDALAQQYEGRLAETREATRQAQVEQLRRRLIDLAGFGRGPWPGSE